MLPNLVYYVQFLTDAQRYSDGFFGYVLELAVKDFFNLPLLISPPEKKDVKATIYDNSKHYIEVKQNGGDFRSACHGSGMIAYTVYIDLDKPLNQQFGYVMPMSIFRTVGAELKHIRSEKKDKNGNLKMSLQSLYNYKENDYHGKKAFKLADSWEDNGAITFKDCFVKQSNIGNGDLNQLTANKSKLYFIGGFNYVNG